MTEGELRELLDAIERLVGPRLKESEPLRRVAGLLGRWLVDEAAKFEGTAVPLERHEPVPTVPGIQKPDHADDAEPQDPAVVETLPLRIGNAVARVNVSGSREEVDRAKAAAEAVPVADDRSRIVAQIDLSVVERRCRLKAESCRLYIERMHDEGNVTLENDVVEMIARAKTLPSCFLWVFWRGRIPPGEGDLRTIAQCYSAHADGASLVHRLLDIEEPDREDLEEAFQLLAEANSCLRIALLRTWLTAPDVDQDEVHLWLRQETRNRSIYVPRYMSLEDPADPGLAEDLSRRVAGSAERLNDRAKHEREVAAAVKKCGYHVRLLSATSGDEAQHHWTRIADSIRTLIAHGVRSSEPRIAEVLRPVVGRVSEAALDAEARAFIEESGRAAVRIDHPGCDAENELDKGEVWSARVLQARALLAGRRLVVIGGERRPDAIDRFVEAFGLGACDWVELVEHGPGKAMIAPIQRADTVAVLALVKLAGHHHVDEAREHARRGGRPFVMIPAGYNPEQVANAILDQVGDRLRRQNARVASPECAPAI